MKKQNSTTFPTYHNNTNNSNLNNNYNTNQNEQYTQSHFYNQNNNNNNNTTNNNNNQRQHQQQQRNRCQIIPSEQFLLPTPPPTQYQQQHPTSNQLNYQQQQNTSLATATTTMSSLTTSNFLTNQFNNFNSQQQQQYLNYQNQQQPFQNQTQHQQQQQQHLPNYNNFQQRSNLSYQQPQMQQPQQQQQRRQQLQLPLFNQNSFNQQSQQFQQQRRQLCEQAQQNVAISLNNVANTTNVANNNLNCSTINGVNNVGQNKNEMDKFSMDANEIANFIANELLMQQLVSVDGIQSGVPTLTTQTLTPTTLRTIEDAFTQLIEEPITAPFQAGFIPPTYPTTSNNTTTTSNISGFNGSVHDFNESESDDSRISLGPRNYDDYQGGETTDNSSATTDSTSFQNGLRNSLATSNSNSASTNDFTSIVSAAAAAAGKKNNTNTSSSITTNTPPPTRRNQGGRRPAKASNLSPEEEEKRRVRRERNKLAAARCRKRRVDLTNELLDEVAQLEKKREGLQKDIETLNSEKQQLQYVLEAHRPTCQKIRQDLLSVRTCGGVIAPMTNHNDNNNINITGIDTTLASTGRSSPLDLKPIILNDSILSVQQIKDEPLDNTLDTNSLDNDEFEDEPAAKRMLLSNNNPMIPPPLPKIATLSPSLAAAASLNTPIMTTAPVSFGSFGSSQNNAMVVNTLNALNKPLLSVAKQRPTTLPTMPRNSALGLNVGNKPLTDINGVAIQTPSTGMFNFDSLMDGGTGLTPVSGPLVPNCSSQNKHPLELTTPTSEPSKLVSL